MAPEAERKKSSWGGMTGLRKEEWKKNWDTTRAKEASSAYRGTEVTKEPWMLKREASSTQQPHMEGSSNCILLQLHNFPSQLFTAFRVQQKSSVQPKTDGRTFNSEQTDSGPGESPKAVVIQRWGTQGYRLRVLRGLLQVAASAGSYGCCRKRSNNGYTL